MSSSQTIRFDSRLCYAIFGTIAAVVARSVKALYLCSTLSYFLVTTVSSNSLHKVK